MDHDRASGEGVGVQEYTGIKLKVLLDQLEKTPVNERVMVNDKHVSEQLSSPDFKKALDGRSLQLVCATLRPETMYGQTNCFVGTELQYGVYAVNSSEAWVCTERAANNMAWQGLFETKGKVVKLFDLKGWDLIGLPLSAPLTPYKVVYCLPMENVLASKVYFFDILGNR
jgi:leucyl-tRNA synthetase